MSLLPGLKTEHFQGTKPQGQTPVAWRGESVSESRLARLLAGHISPTTDKKRQAEELFQLVVGLLGKTIEGVDANDISLHKAFPVHDSEVTSNLISQIAYEVEARDSDLKITGSYFTPPILAMDMVKVAAHQWLENTKSTHIKTATWYDPCVGGGVFPVAIAEYLLIEGLEARQIVDRIAGCDINPLFAEVTKIRLALILSKGNFLDFHKFHNKLSYAIISQDALVNFTEVTNIFSLNKTRYDIVVGNPPYVRSNSIPLKTKEALKHLYPSIWTGTADLYMFFIAHGINALQEHGVLCYVSPATFQRTHSGQMVRDFITHKTVVNMVYDFDELEVFKNVSSHISVYVLSKTLNKENDTGYILFDSLPAANPLYKYNSSRSLTKLPARDTAWNFHLENPSILDYLEQNAFPLRKYTQIYSGIKTGLKKAYELTAAEHHEIIQDHRSRRFVFPLLKPQQIERWSLRWQNTYQIVVPRGSELDTKSKAYHHLLKYKEELRQRTDLKLGDAWYSLRDCAYLNLFNAPKIVYRDISSTPRFAIDRKGMLVVDGAFFIPAEDYFLLGLLNSKVGAFYFRNRCAAIGSVGSRARLRFKKVYVSEFPVPYNISEDIKAAIGKLSYAASSEADFSVEAEEKLDELVLDLYKIPQEYRKTILATA